MSRFSLVQSGTLALFIIHLYPLLTSELPVQTYDVRIRNSESSSSMDKNLALNDVANPRSRRIDRKHLNSSENRKIHYSIASGWPVDVTGNITGVDYDNDGNVIIFHRGGHVWSYNTFNFSNHYMPKNQGPIKEDTIYKINPKTKNVLHQWGRNLFYMPHGLTVDKKGFLWLTDVALHQVFKFPIEGSSQALLTLGTRFIPGNGKKQFCKPTSVAIDRRNDDIYVADGYCNSRIVRFSSDGTYLNEWGQPDNLVDKLFGNISPYTLNIPHKIILIESLDLSCVADREHARILCYKIPNGEFHSALQTPEFSGTVYSISYSPSCGGLLFAINGKDFKKFPNRDIMKGFVFNFTTRELLGTFNPQSGSFDNPHDIASSLDCEEVFVVEVGPNSMWRFDADTQNKSSFNLTKRLTSYVNGFQALSSKASSIVRDQVPAIASQLTSTFSTTTIVLTLLILPVVVVIILAIMINRTRYRWKYNRSSLKNLSGWVSKYKAAKNETKLGRILKDPRSSGFNQLATEDSNTSDQEYYSESEVEEFNIKDVTKA